MHLLKVTASSTILNPDPAYQSSSPLWIVPPPDWVNVANARDDDTGTQATWTYGNLFSSSPTFARAFRLQATPPGSSWVCFGAEILTESTSAEAGLSLQYHMQRTPGSSLYSRSLTIPGAGTHTDVVTGDGSLYIPGTVTPYVTVRLFYPGSVAVASQVVGVKEVRFLYKPRGVVRFQEIG